MSRSFIRARSRLFQLALATVFLSQLVAAPRYGLVIFQGIPAANAAETAALVSPFDVRISFDELSQGIEEVLGQVPEFRVIRDFAQARNIRVWLLGGSASSLAEAIKLHKALGEKSPLFRSHYELNSRIHDIFSFQQDTDLAIDGTFQQANELKTLLDNQFPYVLNVASTTNNVAATVPPQKRKSWDVMTLHTQNNRGLVGDPNFLNQDSDSLSLGLIEVTPVARDQLIKFIPEWDRGSPDNTFTRDLLEHKITYYRKPGHSGTYMFQQGKNPEIIEVLRLLTKAFRYHLPITAEDEAQMKAVLALPESRDYSQFSPYVREKILNLAFQMIYDAWDLGYAVETLVKMGLLERLSSWLIMPPTDTRPDKLRKGSFAWLMTFVLKHPEVRSFHPWRYNHMTMSELRTIPDHSIIEGTSLWNGQRAPMFFDREDPDLKPLYDTGDAEIPHDGNVDAGRLMQIATVSQRMSTASSTKIPMRPGFFLLPSTVTPNYDCRDFALNFHVLAAHFGIPNTLHTTTQYTKNLVPMPAYGTDWVVNAHPSAPDVCTNPIAQNYSLSVWTPNDSLRQQYGDYVSSGWGAWLSEAVAEGHIEVISTLIQYPELLSYFPVAENDLVAIFSDALDSSNPPGANIPSETKAVLSAFWISTIKTKVSGTAAEPVNLLASQALMDFALNDSMNKTGANAWLFQMLQADFWKYFSFPENGDSVIAFKKLLQSLYAKSDSLDKIAGSSIAAAFDARWKAWTQPVSRQALVLTFAPYLRFPPVQEAVLGALADFEDTGFSDSLMIRFIRQSQIMDPAAVFKYAAVRRPELNLQTLGWYQGLAEAKPDLAKQVFAYGDPTHSQGITIDFSSPEVLSFAQGVLGDQRANAELFFKLHAYVNGRASDFLQQRQTHPIYFNHLLQLYRGLYSEFMSSYLRNQLIKKTDDAARQLFKAVPLNPGIWLSEDHPLAEELDAIFNQITNASTLNPQISHTLIVDLIEKTFAADPAWGRSALLRKWAPIWLAEPSYETPLSNAAPELSVFHVLVSLGTLEWTPETIQALLRNRTHLGNVGAPLLKLLLAREDIRQLPNSKNLVMALIRSAPMGQYGVLLGEFLEKPEVIAWPGFHDAFAALVAPQQLPFPGRMGIVKDILEAVHLAQPASYPGLLQTALINLRSVELMDILPLFQPTKFPATATVERNSILATLIQKITPEGRGRVIDEVLADEAMKNDPALPGLLELCMAAQSRANAGQVFMYLVKRPGSFSREAFNRVFDRALSVAGQKTLHPLWAQWSHNQPDALQKLAARLYPAVRKKFRGAISVYQPTEQEAERLARQDMPELCRHLLEAIEP